MNIEPIIRVSDRPYGGGIVRSLYGLNLFRANHVDVTPASDPRIVFLQAVAETYEGILHIGDSGLEGDSVSDVIKGKYSEVPVDIMNNFINGNGYVASIRELKDVVNIESIIYLLTMDAIALYICPKVPGAMDRLLEKVPGMVSRDVWLSHVSRFYNAAVFSSSDGWIIDVYAHSVQEIPPLDNALIKAADAVRTTDWFRKNQARMRWVPGDLDNCLKVGA